jgi:hypothetical protein
MCRTHHWVVATPNGRRTSRGTCKNCGMTKRFPNAFYDIIRESATGDIASKPAAHLLRR